MYYLSFLLAAGKSGEVKRRHGIFYNFWDSRLRGNDTLTLSFRTWCGISFRKEIPVLHLPAVLPTLKGGLRLTGMTS